MLDWLLSEGMVLACCGVSARVALRALKSIMYFLWAIPHIWGNSTFVFSYRYIKLKRRVFYIPLQYSCTPEALFNFCIPFD